MVIMLKLGFVILGSLAISVYMFRRKHLLEEWKRNDEYDMKFPDETPKGHQLRWDIRHLREDIAYMTAGIYIIAILLLAILVKIF